MTPQKFLKDARSSVSTPAWLQWGLYPALWCWVIVCITYASEHEARISIIQMVEGVAILVLLLFCEWKFPYQKRWAMTLPFLFKRDLIFIIVNATVIGLTTLLVGALAIFVSNFTQGPLSEKSIWLQVLVGLFAFEVLQYSVHRFMHESRGPLTHFLWRSHAIHHLPQQLYVVMHAVFHPINAIFVRVLVQLLPVWIFGFDPLAVFITVSIVGLHGLISHFNMDMRMGWANYLFVGPELHRYHHSANSNEAANYGSTLSLFDLLLNTFHYTPGIAPDALGLKSEDGYPEQIEALKSFLFAFHISQVKPPKS